MKDLGKTDNRNIKLWCGYEDSLPTCIDMHENRHECTLIEKEDGIYRREICQTYDMWREIKLTKVE